MLQNAERVHKKKEKKSGVLGARLLDVTPSSKTLVDLFLFCFVFVPFKRFATCGLVLLVLLLQLQRFAIPSFIPVCRHTPTYRNSLRPVSSGQPWIQFTSLWRPAGTNYVNRVVE